MNMVRGLRSWKGRHGGGLNVGGTPMTKFVAFLRDESGASAAEYALILAIVGAAIATAALGLGQAIANAMNDAAARI
jgi:pilus assembly protein Flp/PilA